MLVAKLAKGVEKVYQKMGSIEVETVLCDHIAVRVGSYDLNGNCTVVYKIGKVDLNAEQHEKFKSVLRNSILLNKEDVETWGTDDTELLRIVANKLTLEIEEIFELAGEDFKQ